MKAVIISGNKQHMVQEGDELDIELLHGDKQLSFEPVLLIGDTSVQVGTPVVSGASVQAEVVTERAQAAKVTSIRFKSKKRVHKVKGHRQQLTRIRITKITTNT